MKKPASLMLLGSLAAQALPATLIDRASGTAGEIVGVPEEWDTDKSYPLQLPKLMIPPIMIWVDNMDGDRVAMADDNLHNGYYYVTIKAQESLFHCEDYYLVAQDSTGRQKKSHTFTVGHCNRPEDRDVRDDDDSAEEPTAEVTPDPETTSAAANAADVPVSGVAKKIVTVVVTENPNDVIETVTEKGKPTCTRDAVVTATKWTYNYNGEPAYEVLYHPALDEAQKDYYDELEEYIRRQKLNIEMDKLSKGSQDQGTPDDPVQGAPDGSKQGTQQPVSNLVRPDPQDPAWRDQLWQDPASQYHGGKSTDLSIKHWA